MIPTVHCLQYTIHLNFIGCKQHIDEKVWEWGLLVRSYNNVPSFSHSSVSPKLGHQQVWACDSDSIHCAAKCTTCSYKHTSSPTSTRAHRYVTTSPYWLCVRSVYNVHALVVYIASFPCSCTPEPKHWSCAGVESLVLFVMGSIKGREVVETLTMCRHARRLRTWKERTEQAAYYTSLVIGRGVISYTLCVECKHVYSWLKSVLKTLVLLCHGTDTRLSPRTHFFFFF